MKKIIAAIAVLAVLTSTAALAGPPAKGKKSAKPAKSAAKVVDLYFCPITGEKVMGKGAGTPVVVDGKRVHFCCGGCPETFAKLSAADKKAKVAAAVKKADETTKTKKS